MMAIRTLICALGTLLFAVTAFAKTTTINLDELSRKEIAERIAPVGKVCEQGQPCASQTMNVASQVAEPRTGEQIFQQYCTACHTSGLLGAPKVNDTERWTARMKEVGGFGTLLSNAISGINAMPAKGTCMDCSDEEISVAIEYMSGLKP